jgi:hypothetical protein
VRGGYGAKQSKAKQKGSGWVEAKYEVTKAMNCDWEAEMELAFLFSGGERAASGRRVGREG